MVVVRTGRLRMVVVGRSRSWFAVVGGGGLHEIAGELFADELVVGKVAVEGADDPVAIAPRERVGVVFVATIGIAIAGDIQPMSTPAFAIVR